MAVEGDYFALKILSAADLSAYQYFPVTAAGARATGATAYATAIGINQEKPLSGEHFRVTWLGESKFRAGGTITAGAHLTLNASGYFVAATSGLTISGRAVLAATSGSIGTGIFDFAAGMHKSAVSYA